MTTTTFPHTYPEAIRLLLSSDKFDFKVRKDLRTGNIEGIEISYSPLLRDTGCLFVRELLGERFTAEWIGNENDFILVKLKQ